MLLRKYFGSQSITDYLLRVQHIRIADRKHQSSVKCGQSDAVCHPVVIAHRGACGYVPEHTLASYAVAVLMGADYIEPDLVVTCDHQLIARHDNELGLTTDVSLRPEFASRHKNKTIDGKNMSGWFSEDFSLKEIKTLRAIERIPSIRPGNTRFNGIFEVPTLQEIINLAKSLEISQKRGIGIIPELKHSTYFRRHGLPMEKAVVNIAHSNGYTGLNAPFCIQSFEINNLKELKTLTELKLMQILGMPWEKPFDTTLQGCTVTYKNMATPDGLRQIARYAHYLGVEENYIIPRRSDNRLGCLTSLVQDAHAAGLKVVVYTFRGENHFLPVEYLGGDCSPASIGNFSDYLRAFCASGIDGLFCDHPDIPIRLRTHSLSRPQL